MKTLRPAPTLGLFSVFSCFLAFAGCAAPADEPEVSNAELSEAKRCQLNSECGGGSAVCFVGHCARVEDETRSPGASRVAAAFEPTGNLKVAYATVQSRLPEQPANPMLTFGPWDGAAGNVATIRAGWAWTVDSPPGAAPKIAFSTSTKLVFEDDPFHATSWLALSSPNANAIADFAVAENAAGTKFAAMKLVKEDRSGGTAVVTHGTPGVHPSGVTTNEIWLSSIPANGSWSSPEKVYQKAYASGSDHSLNLVAVHPRLDGAADVLYTEDHAFLRAHRQTPTDPYAGTPPGTWSVRNTLVAKYDWISAHRGGDGSTHVAFGKTVGSQSTGIYSPPVGVFDNSYLEINDRGFARNVSLGRTTGAPGAPLYKDIGVDGTGIVWMLKQTSGAHPLSIVRVDRAGIAVEGKLDDLALPPSSSLAVAKDGTIALVWTALGEDQPIHLRRFIPVH